MQKHTHTNTFEKGMRQDLTKDGQQSGSYRDAVGMGLRFQPADGGQAMNLTAVYGSELVYTLPAGYDEVGSVAIFLFQQPYLLLFLTNGTNSEFGLLDVPSRLTPFDPLTDVPTAATYTQLYSDAFDPNGDVLGWQMGNTLRVSADIESGQRARILVNDRINEPLYIPLHLGFATATDLSPHSLPYPRYWSASSFQQQPTVHFSVLQFISRTSGSLPTGGYRASYRYVLSPSGMPEEVVSVCYPPDPGFVLPQGDPASGNEHLVFLREAGVPTTYGLRFGIERADSRWSRVQLLISYSADGSAWGPWVIADQKDNPAGFVSLSHTIPQGIGRLLDEGEISAQWQTVRSAADIHPFKNRMWTLGPVVGLTDPLSQVTASGVTLAPFYRQQDLDIKRNTTFLTADDVLSNRSLATTDVTEQLYKKADGTYATRSYANAGDFNSYKSIQLSARHQAYRHKERYPIGLLLIDEKGQPASVIPLGDFVAPGIGDIQQLTTYDPATGNYYLSILQLRVSGIRIPRSVIFDANGVRRVSGFKIVRGAASGTILYQGVVLNLVRQDGNAQASNRLSVLPTFSNYGADTADGVVRDSRNLPVLLSQGEADFGHAGLVVLQQGYVSFHSGDLLMEDGALVADKNTDTLELQASAHPVYETRPGVLISGPIHLEGANDHTYTKNYSFQKDPVRPNAKGRSWPGTSSPVNSSFLLNYWGGDSNELKLVLDPESPEKSVTGNVSAYVQQPNNVDHNTFKEGYAMKNTTVLRVPGIGLIDAGRQPLDPAGVQIANYIRQRQPLPADSIDYQTTGHFQSLDDGVLADLPFDGHTYLIDGVDVGGGDTFVCPTDILRIYPAYFDSGMRQPYVVPGDENNGTGLDFPDFAVGMIVPMENKFNLDMRAGGNSGKHYAEYASYPSGLARGSVGLDQFSKSINQYQAEYWNAALATKVGTETVRLFKKRPADFRIDSDRPYDILWSDLRTTGETLYRLRRLPPLNSFTLPGDYGPPVILAEEFLYLYVGHPDAIGRLQISERSQTVDDSGKTLLLGTGDTMTGVDYVLRGAGISLWQDHWHSPKALYWVDRRRGKWARLSQAGVDVLSDRDGQHDTLTQLLSQPGSPLLPGDRAVAGVYDPINQRILISFWDRTLIYNEDLNLFEGRFNELAARYHQMGGAVFSRQPNSPGFWRHGTGITGTVYGQPELIEVEYIVNPLPTAPSTFEQMWLSLPQKSAEALIRVDLSTASQQQVLLPLEDDRIDYEEDRLYLLLRQQEIPDVNGEPVEVFDRLRGKVLVVRLQFSAALTTGVIQLQTSAVSFRPSPKY